MGDDLMPLYYPATRRLLLACVVASALGCASASAVAAPVAAAASAVRTYDLQAQSLETAIQAVALRSRRTILAPSPLWRAGRPRR
jgi:hypothetical protein